MATEWATIIPEIGLGLTALFCVWAIWRTVRGIRGRALNVAVGLWLTGLVVISSFGVARRHWVLADWDWIRPAYVGIWGALILTEAAIVALAWREDGHRRVANAEKGRVVAEQVTAYGKAEHRAGAAEERLAGDARAATLAVETARLTDAAERTATATERAADAAEVLTGNAGETT